MDIEARSSVVASRKTTARASLQDGTYPRPQLVRSEWVDLCGEWSLGFDDDNSGIAERWFLPNALERFDRRITVPFPPESAASGIHDTGFHPVVWYRVEISVAGLAADGERILLHFGAVDYRCTVWLNGSLLGRHEGGHTPFSFDINDAISATPDSPQLLVVRAEDDPFDVGQPRGKQDWQLEPHVIWYHRTTGIWQPVWLEAVPELAVRHLTWTTNVPLGQVRLAVELSHRPIPGTRLDVALEFEGLPLANQCMLIDSDRLELTIPIPRQTNGQNYEQLLWSDETPRLIDATVTVGDDTVKSYFGLRSVAVEGGRFLLNDRPLYLRSVLSQGFWPQSHLAAPSVDALLAEVQLIKALGFNAARVHQKIEDPRFLFWADRLGLLLWEEMPSAYEFSPTAARRVISEWSDVLRRDSSHPSIVTWVPLNESWGVQHIAHDAAVRDYARALYYLTKSTDPTRPVISNDGWEHVDSDIWSIHDYEASGDVVAARYANQDSVDALFNGFGPAGRRLRVSDERRRGQAVMLTEFGGIKFTPDDGQHEFSAAAWGYSSASSVDDFTARFLSLLVAVGASEVLAGYCYTQLTDTGQETNGLLTGERQPKLPIAVVRSIVTGMPSPS
jgi:beta-galactosidase/beta-glucuronidase